MKVAINAWFYNQINTGSGQYLRYLVQALTDLAPDLEIVLIVPAHQADPALTWPPQVQVKSVFTPPGHVGKVWFEQVIFPQVAQAYQADVAHVPYFGSALITRLPTVVTIHDLIPLILPAYRGRVWTRLYTRLVAWAAQQADCILADSDASRGDILTHLSYRKATEALLPYTLAKVHTVYLAPAPHYTLPTDREQVAAIRRKYKLPQSFVLYLGGFDIRKNVVGLVQAWAEVLDCVEGDLNLVLAGQLPLTETAFFPDPLKVAQNLQIQETIYTPGWIDERDKPGLYAAALAFAYPSHYEGFGLPVLEAMACGTPVVTSTVSSLPELAGLAAPQVDPDNVTELAQALVDLTTVPESHANAVRRGLEQARKFSWSDTAAQTLQAYAAVLPTTIGTKDPFA